MILNICVCGSGLNLVLLHGWGFHGGIWADLSATLAGWGYQIHIVDLPGHGKSSGPIPSPNVDDWARAILAIVPPDAIWIGWSLGGMVALAAAILDPANMQGLVLIGATPRFGRSADWPAGIDAELLADFGRGLKENWRATLLRFLALQTRALTNQTIRNLRTTMLAFPPHPTALASGLIILQETDLRSRLASVICPTLVLLGERDTLVAAALAQDLFQLRPDWEIHLLPGAGHLPFLTHPAEFNFLLAKWLAQFVKII